MTTRIQAMTLDGGTCPESITLQPQQQPFGTALCRSRMPR